MVFAVRRAAADKNWSQRSAVGRLVAVATPEQVRRLVALYEGAPRELVSLLAGQFAVLKQQAQSILGISGLCITVTGFSGHNMVRAGPIPTALMVGTGAAARNQCAMSSGISR